MGRRSDNYLPRAERSNKVPFKEDETWQERHDRRKDAALSEEDEMKVWADEHFVDLEIKNHGHHWVFTRDKGVVEWWPSSGRLVLNRNYRKPSKAHDTDQAKERIGKWLNVPQEIK